jgi:DNA-binding MurR/RpiR family transcriptional regulator
MTYEDRIRRERPNMSKSFAKLADYLLDSYIEASFMTASELAHELNLDAATVVRFSQNLGYKGYPELLKEIRNKVKLDLLIRPDEASISDSIPGVVSRSMQEIIQELEQTRISLDTDAMNRLTDTIGNSRRIVVLAEPSAQPAAYNLVYFLEQGGFSIYIARSGLADLARTIYTATPNDLIMAIDIAGQSPYIARSLREAHQRSIPTAAIVGAASLESARAADYVLAAQERPSVGVGMTVISAIIYALVECLRWKFADRFAGVEQAIYDLTRLIQQYSE